MVERSSGRWSPPWITSIILATILLAGCGNCDGPTMPSGPEVPPPTKIRDNVSKKLKNIQKKHQQRRREAMPESSFLPDAGSR